MRLSYLVIAVVSLGACATRLEISSTTVTRWDDLDVSYLITAIGPFDTTTIQGDSRTYFWNRFGNCQVTARTTREDKIVKVDVQGTARTCSPYLEKMGDVAPPPPPPPKM